MNRTYHTDLDRDDFEAGELLPWQDMSRHLQALEEQFKMFEGIIKTYFDEGPSKRIHNLEEQVNKLQHHVNQDWDQIAALHRKIDTLEKALQTTTDSLRQAHLLIKNLQTHTIRSEEKIEVLEEETPIYNRAYVDRQFRDGELEY